MHEGFQLELYTLGHRDYVNGLTLFEESLKRFFAGADPHGSVSLFKMNRFVRGNARVEVGEASDTELRARAAKSNAELVLETGGASLRLLIQEEPAEVEGREDVDRGAYVKSDTHFDDGRSEAVLHGLSDTYDLLRGLVEVNHRFSLHHTAALELPPTPSWAFMRDFCLRTPAELGGELSVRCTLERVRRAFGRTYITRSLTLPELDSEAALTLCFFSR